MANKLYRREQVDVNRKTGWVVDLGPEEGPVNDRNYFYFRTRTQAKRFLEFVNQGMDTQRAAELANETTPQQFFQLRATPERTARLYELGRRIGSDSTATIIDHALGIALAHTPQETNMIEQDSVEVLDLGYQGGIYAAQGDSGKWFLGRFVLKTGQVDNGQSFARGHGRNAVLYAPLNIGPFNSLEAARVAAVQRLPTDELAERIYIEVDGADHKQHAAEKTQEILDWIERGDITGRTFEQLVAEWREYDISAE